MAKNSSNDRSETAAEAAKSNPDLLGGAGDKESTVKLVRMVRGENSEPGYPSTADVHPDEVANYARFGWEVAK